MVGDKSQKERRNFVFGKLIESANFCIRVSEGQPAQQSGNRHVNTRLQFRGRIDRECKHYHGSSGFRGVQSLNGGEFFRLRLCNLLAVNVSERKNFQQ